MEKYKVESDIPLPKARSTKYPLSKMKVGDSFFSDSTNINDRNSIRQAAKRIGITVVSRKVDGGFRVWRIA